MHNSRFRNTQSLLIVCLVFTIRMPDQSWLFDCRFRDRLVCYFPIWVNGLVTAHCFDKTVWGVDCQVCQCLSVGWRHGHHLIPRRMAIIDCPLWWKLPIIVPALFCSPRSDLEPDVFPRTFRTANISLSIIGRRLRRRSYNIFGFFLFITIIVMGIIKP